MKTVNFDVVRRSAADFFDKHWNVASPERPQWNAIWEFIGGLPGGNSQGVYLLLNKNDEVLYVGSAVAKVGGIYKNHGLGVRTQKYHCLSEGQRSVANDARKYEPKNEWAERGLAKIVTISFTPEYAYMACALEAYLIREAQTPHNIRGAIKMS